MPFAPLLIKRAEVFDPNNPAHGPTAGSFGPEIYNRPLTGTDLRDRVGTELLDHPERYPTLIPWLNYVLGEPGAQDPFGAGEDNPDIEFPNHIRKFRKHREEFNAPYEDAKEYWRDAVDLVERGRAEEPGTDSCARPYDQAEIFWDEIRQAIVIVKNGEIETYFPPEDGVDYYDSECARITPP